MADFSGSEIETLYRVKSDTSQLDTLNAAVQNSKAQLQSLAGVQFDALREQLTGIQDLLQTPVGQENAQALAAEYGQIADEIARIVPQAEAAAPALQQLGNAEQVAGQQAQQASQQLKTLGDTAQQGGLNVRQAFTAITTTVASFYGVIRAGEEVVSLGKTGAEAMRTEEVFRSLATSAGTSSDAVLTSMRRASAGTISDLQLMQEASRTWGQGVQVDAEQFGELMDLARAKAHELGLSTEQAFADIETGLARGSSRIFKSLGIEDTNLAIKEYASQLGIAESKMTDAEKRQALLNTVLKDAKDQSGAAGSGITDMADQYDQAATRIENAKAKIAKNLAPIGAGILEGIAGWLERGQAQGQEEQAWIAEQNRAVQEGKLADAIQKRNELETALRGSLSSTTDSERQRAQAVLAAAQADVDAAQAVLNHTRMLEAFAGVQAKAKAAQSQSLIASANIDVPALDETRRIPQQQEFWNAGRVREQEAALQSLSKTEDGVTKAAQELQTAEREGDAIKQLAAQSALREAEALLRSGYAAYEAAGGNMALLPSLDALKAKLEDTAASAISMANALAGSFIEGQMQAEVSDMEANARIAQENANAMTRYQEQVAQEGERQAQEAMRKGVEEANKFGQEMKNAVQKVASEIDSILGKSHSGIADVGMQKKVDDIIGYQDKVNETERRALAVVNDWNAMSITPKMPPIDIPESVLHKGKHAIDQFVSEAQAAFSKLHPGSMPWRNELLAQGIIPKEIFDQGKDAVQKFLAQATDLFDKYGIGAEKFINKDKVKEELRQSLQGAAELRKVREEIMHDPEFMKTPIDELDAALGKVGMGKTLGDALKFEDFQPAQVTSQITSHLKPPVLKAFQQTFTGIPMAENFIEAMGAELKKVLDDPRIPENTKKALQPMLDIIENPLADVKQRFSLADEVFKLFFPTQSEKDAELLKIKFPTIAPSDQVLAESRKKVSDDLITMGTSAAPTAQTVATTLGTTFNTQLYKTLDDADPVSHVHKRFVDGTTQYSTQIQEQGSRLVKLYNDAIANGFENTNYVQHLISLIDKQIQKANAAMGTSNYLGGVQN